MLRSRALHWYMGTLVWGQAHARSLAEWLREFEHEDPGPYLSAFLDIGRGHLCRLEGDLDQAHELFERGIETQEALGLRFQAASQAMGVAKVHMSAGDPAAAVDALTRSDAVLAEHGERPWRSTVQARLARAHAALHDREAALAACHLSDELSAAEDVINYAITHAVRAQLALEQGDSEQALQWANSAVDYAFQADRPEYQADTKLDLARVLSALGRRDEGMSAACEALAIHEAKGDRPGMAEAQALLAEL
jgi:tetratricopeptide (TPR) repeat protein